MSDCRSSDSARPHPRTPTTCDAQTAARVPTVVLGRPPVFYVVGFRTESNSVESNSAVKPRMGDQLTLRSLWPLRHASTTEVSMVINEARVRTASTMTSTISVPVMGL